jgi:8-oxo-dGTP pyrophosphatase MutT (NUDIX family)
LYFETMIMSSIAPNVERLVTSADLPARVAAALAAGHRGAADRWRMSPQQSYGRHAGPAPHTARAAAVMLLLFRRDGRWHLPLTERPLTLVRHAGQISLPGGAVEPRETSHAAAVRELHEELGVAPEGDLLGRLADCYVFASDFMITPWVAVTNAEPRWQPDVREVQSVVELPLEVLLSDDAVGRLTIERGPLMFHAPCLRAADARIWGATSTILAELGGVLRELMEN